MRMRMFVFLLAGCLAAAGASAADEPPNLAGVTLDNRPFDLAQRRGRVVMLMLWRTDCAVCLSKMPELRANAAGWQHKPFDLVMLNLDPNRDDALAYEQARQQTGVARAPVWSLWQGSARLPAAWLQPQRLPVLLLLGADGRITKRWEGRVPPEAWDEVAHV